MENIMETGQLSDLNMKPFDDYGRVTLNLGNS